MEFLDDDEIQAITNSSWMKNSHINIDMGFIRDQFPEIGSFFNTQSSLNAEYPSANSTKWFPMISNGIREKGNLDRSFWWFPGKW
jgi:hypothetical protein